MRTPEGPVPGFIVSRPPRDGWVAHLFEKHGLPESPSLQEIEPVAKALLADIATRNEGIELVIGRRVDAEEFSTSPLFGAVAFMTDKDQAFGCLLMLREIDQAEDQAP